MSARDDYPTLANHALGKLQFVSVSDAGAITAALDEIDRLRAALTEWHYDDCAIATDSASECTCIWQNR